MTTQMRLLTYEEYLRTPDIKARYDIFDEVLTMAPAPTLGHPKSSANYFWSFTNSFRSTNLERSGSHRWTSSYKENPCGLAAGSFVRPQGAHHRRG